MKFSWPSFLLGYAAGAATAAISSRLRPFALAVATAAYRLLDAAAARIVMVREDAEDLLAEARARARATVAATDEGEEPALH